MSDPILYAISGAAIVLLLAGLVLASRQALRQRARQRLEDALKIMLASRSRSAIMEPRTLAGAMHLSEQTALSLLGRMEQAGLTRTHDGGVELTEVGEQAALHMLRAHRLLERYFADETGVALQSIHRLAERSEHYLTDDQLNELDEQLGRPRTDPHGDRIPRRIEDLDESGQTALSRWPIHEPAEVVHVEDEPEANMRQLLRAGLKPGAVVTIDARKQGALVIESPAGEHSIPQVLGGQVQVKPAETSTLAATPHARLCDLSVGARARVVGLADDCRGLPRRRLLDLGITPGTMIESEMANLGRSAVAYRVRDTLIALRHEQAQHILIDPIATSAPAREIAG